MIITSLREPSTKRIGKLPNSLDFSNESLNGTGLITSKKIGVSKKTDNDLFNNKNSKTNEPKRLNYDIRLSKSDKDALLSQKNSAKQTSDGVPVYILSKSNKIYSTDFQEIGSQSSRVNYVKQIEQSERKHPTIKKRHFDSSNRIRSKNSSKESLENLDEKNSTKNFSIDLKEIK
ncbi:unnamed protein product, partial [Brachionus calyciflorus]